MKTIHKADPREMMFLCTLRLYCDLNLDLTWFFIVWDSFKSWICFSLLMRFHSHNNCAIWINNPKTNMVFFKEIEYHLSVSCWLNNNASSNYPQNISESVTHVTRKLFLDAIASPSTYPCQLVGQWVSHS